MRKQFLKTSLALLVFLGMALSVSAQNLDKARVTVDMTNATVKQFLDEIERQTGIEFLYNANEVKSLPLITVKETNANAQKVINKVMAEIGCECKENNGIYIVKNLGVGKGTLTVEGHVFDEHKEPVIGAQVKVMGTKLLTVTDMDGKFSFNQPVPEKARIQISFIGMETVQVTAKRNMVVNMKSNTQMLENVVVTGYQQLDRRNLTSSVTSKSMEELDIPGVADLSKMLEGKIPDLISVANSGEVNATSRIRIRGTSTIVGNREPLWVLDGIILTDPVDLSPDVLNDPDYVNRIGNAIAGINPQDIQRIDVLKDAAATALYGTRAANGVIVVTTKSGREGKPIISYTGQLTARKRPYYTDRKINLMNSAERIQFSQFLVDQQYKYPVGMAHVGYEWALTQYYAKQISHEEFLSQVEKMMAENTDWFDLLCHNSFSHDHNVSISGGSEKIRYYTSVGYTDQDDVINNTMNRRYTAMAKIDFDLSRKFKLQFNVSGYLNDREYSVGDTNPINYAYNTSRTIPAFNEDGSYYFYQQQGAGGIYHDYNILHELENTSQQNETNSISATANLRYQATENLFFNGVFSANISNAASETWYGEESFYARSLKRAAWEDPAPGDSQLPYGGEFRKNTNKNIGWTARLQANYNKYFGADKQHNANIAFGLEASSNHSTGDSYVQRGYYKDRGRSFATGILSGYTAYWDWMRYNVPSIVDATNNIISAYATLTYSFRNLFSLNVNGRYDGSNKFGSRSNEKILPIWSVSGNANLMNIFGIKNNWLDHFALKSSYGEQGNMLDNQTPELIIKKGNMNAYYGEMISTPAYFANPDLKWEKTRSFNVGLESSLFGGRLSFETEYYYKKTTDAFLDKVIADVNGFNSYVVNSGTIENSGFNFSVSATPIKYKDFYWILSGNISKVYNKIKTAPGAETYELSNFLNGSAVVQGQPIGTFYSYRFAGLSAVDGGPLIDDMEDRQMELMEAKNYQAYTKVLVPSGRREPNVTGSINNTFTYKQLRLSTSMTFSLGAKTRLFRLFDAVSERGIKSENNINRELLNRWQKPGDEKTTTIPAVMGQGTNGYYYYSSHWSDGYPYSGAVIAQNAWRMYDYSTVRVVSGNYMKLSNVSLTYEFNQKQLERLKLGRLALTLSAYNVHTWSNKALRGQTPTQGGFTEVQLGDTPSYTFSVNINF